MANKYFVWSSVFANEPIRVVYRRADVIDPASGYPLSYTLVALPTPFSSYEEAAAEADKLNRGAKEDYAYPKL